jgi:hypothetical protein
MSDDPVPSGELQIANRPWLDSVTDFIRRAIPSAKSVHGPTVVHALYDDSPDQRATLRYVVDDPNHREVVVKVNHFPFLSGSAAAHRLVHRCSPTDVPEVIATEDIGTSSMILLATFEGSPLDSNTGPAHLRDMASTLGRIQVECTTESSAETGLATISPVDLPRLFDECFAKIQAHYPVWQTDDGKLEKAMGFPAAEVLNRLSNLRTNVDRWVQQLQEAGTALSIEHGDCHSGNAILRSDGSILIFDWENAGISHPFLSAEKLLTSGWGMDTGNSGGPWGYIRRTPTQDELKAAYLNEFVEPRSTLERSFDAAMCLAVIKEMHHEMEWARLCGWKDLNPEWTAQLINRLFQHVQLVEI